jgi:hypothetical protein
MPERGTIIESHPVEFFRELVQDAMQAQNVTSGEETEFYLVQLLQHHLRMRGDLLDKPLALEFLEASSAGGVERFQRLKLVGDTALFIAGLFADCLERTVVQPVYYSSRIAASRVSAARRCATCSRSSRYSSSTWCACSARSAVASCSRAIATRCASTAAGS